MYKIKKDNGIKNIYFDFIIKKYFILKINLKSYFKKKNLHNVLENVWKHSTNYFLNFFYIFELF